MTVCMSQLWISFSFLPTKMYLITYHDVTSSTLAVHLYCIVRALASLSSKTRDTNELFRYGKITSKARAALGTDLHEHA